MAEKKLATFDSVMADLKAHRYAPVYILQGEEPYYIDLLADYIADHALAPEERDFNLTVVFGADMSGGQIADLARRYPMMAERQVVIVKEAQNIKQWERIEAYIERPAPTTVLVICHKNGTIDGRKKIVAKAAAVGVVLESKKKREQDLPAFVSNYLSARQASIEPKAAQMIADHIGADLSRLASELDKLLLALPDSDRRITPDTVEEKVGVSKDFNGFELRNAIVNRNVYKATLIANYFAAGPKAGNAFMLIPLLFSYFQNLMVAHYTPAPRNEESIARQLDLRSPWAAREYITGMRNYNASKTLDIIKKIRETDAKSKGLDNPNTPVGELLRELVLYILH